MKRILRLTTAVPKNMPLRPIAIFTVLTVSSGAWAQVLLGSYQPRQEQSCPEGQYAGRPSPGKTRYIKDDYVWAVTREFALRFCMPEEFVSDDLKGAEAIAYQHGKPTGQEICEVKDGREVCAPNRYGHWLEIYVKIGAIPKYDPEVGFYVRNYVTSANVIGSPSRERIIEQEKKKNDARKRGEILESPGQRSPFRRFGSVADSNQISFSYLARISPSQVEVRAAALSERYYQENLYEGIDLITLEGWSWGSIASKDFPEEPPYGYAIGVRREGDGVVPRNYTNEFLHVIELPQRIVRVLNAADRNGGKAFENTVRNLGTPIKPAVR